jgi:hypothetical protein
VSFFDNVSGFVGDFGGFVGDLAQGITQIGQAASSVQHAWSPNTWGGAGIVLPPTPQGTSHPITASSGTSPLLLLGLAGLAVLLIAKTK